MIFKIIGEIFCLKTHSEYIFVFKSTNFRLFIFYHHSIPVPDQQRFLQVDASGGLV
jgi:hypothetical protein